MIGDVKMQTIKRRTGRSLTGDRPLFLALLMFCGVQLLKINSTLEQVFCYEKIKIPDSWRKIVSKCVYFQISTKNNEVQQNKK